MMSLAQLEACVDELAAAVKTLTTQCRNVDAPMDCNARRAPQPLVSPEAPIEAHKARRSIMSSIARLQKQLAEPEDCLQSLAKQNQFLACLQWLGEFQVLACIPLNRSVSFRDVADLANVPETHLCRIVRMTVAEGFLQEPQSGFVAHNALSAPFVTRPSFLDAAMFISKTVAPAALQMAEATRRFGISPKTDASAYNIAFNVSTPFVKVCDQQSSMQRRWSAYLRYVMGDVDADISGVLIGLDWLSLGSASIVEISPQSTAISMALAELHPSLRFTVQMSEPGSFPGIPNGHVPGQSPKSLFSQSPPSNLLHSRSSTPTAEMRHQQFNPRVVIQYRPASTPQTVYGAAAYILRVPSLFSGVASHSVSARIVAELRAHLEVLRTNSSARLIIAAGLLPTPDTMDPSLEAIARIRDLSLLQLAGDRELEIAELIEMLNDVKDSKGSLILADKLYLRNNAMVILEIRYQAYVDRYESDLQSLMLVN